MIGSLYFFSSLLPDSFSLYVSSRYVYSPCCYSSNWQKIGKKQFCFTILLRTFFKKKKLKFLLFGRIFLFIFLFSSVQEKHFCEQTPVLLVFIALYLSLSLKKLFRIFKMNLSFDLFCVLLSYKFFFRPFLITSCFCSSRFEFTSCFISFFVWPFIFLIAIFFDTISPSFVSQNIQLIPFWMHALPLYVLLLMDLFICCLFFFSSFFLVSNTFNLSERQVDGTVANLKKTCLSISLFVFFQIYFVFACLFVFFRNFFFSFYSHVFLNILLLSSRSWMFFPQSLPVMYLIFLKTLFGLIIVFLFFSSSPFTYSPFFTRSHVFWIVSVRTVFFFVWKNCFSCLLVLKKCSFVFSLSSCFFFFSRKIGKWWFVLLLFNLLFWTLHFFQHKLCRKNFMFCVFRSLLIFSFSFICFFMSFFIWFFSISFATCFLF